jgi:phosphotransferase system HPr (HPr) family protein
MAVRKVVIGRKLGLTAAVCMALAQCANKFESKVTIKKDGKVANVKDLMDLMEFGAAFGSVVTVKADGKDENAAIDAVCRLIEQDYELITA